MLIISKSTKGRKKVKKLIEGLLTFTMLFTMFTSIGIVTVNAADTHEVIVDTVWVQDFEKNHPGDDLANWTSSTNAYHSKGRFSSAGSAGAARFVEGTDNNCVNQYSKGSSSKTVQACSKIILDNTKFEIGKKYKLTAEVELVLGSQAEAGETRTIFAYPLADTSATGLGSSTHQYKGSSVALGDGGKAIVSTKSFVYTEGYRDAYNSDNKNSITLRIESNLVGDGGTENVALRDNIYVDNVSIVEVETFTP